MTLRFMFSVYILELSNGKYYVGSTDNLDRRIKQHQEGLSTFTSAFLPVKLKYVEHFSTRKEAWEREKQIHGWSRKKKEMLISLQSQYNSTLLGKNQT